MSPGYFLSSEDGDKELHESIESVSNLSTQ